MSENPYLAVERRLTPVERQTLLDRVCEANPHLRGAHVADVLDMSHDADLYLSRTEPFWEAEPELPEGVETQLMSAALIAAEILGRDDEWAMGMAQLAARPGYTQEQYEADKRSRERTGRGL